MTEYVALQLFIGAFLIAFTVIIQAVVLDYLLHLIERLAPGAFKLFRRLWKIPIMVVAVLGTFLAHIVQIWIWAFLYFFMQVFSDLETALYFSISAFTTVGFGDVYLQPEDWRMISAVESANGFILFGWSTAFIFEVMSKLYKDEKILKIAQQT